MVSKFLRLDNATSYLCQIRQGKLMVYNTDANKEFVGLVRSNGEVIRLSAAITDVYGGIVERTENGIYLLEPEQEFFVLLGNDSNRNTKFSMTGDADSAIMVYDLIVEANTSGVPLKRYQREDRAFKAYVRDSWKGDMVGGKDIADGGGGLIKIVFKLGNPEQPRGWQAMGGDTTRSVFRGGGNTRSADTRSMNLESYGTRGSKGADYVEGAMGSGGSTGQTFGSTNYSRDWNIPELELQLRWAIRLPRGPVGGRIVNRAPSL
jgi:hypothetical protein